MQNAFLPDVPASTSMDDQGYSQLRNSLARALFGCLLIVGGFACAIAFFIDATGSGGRTPIEFDLFFIVASASIAGIGVSVLRNPNRRGQRLWRRFLTVMGAVSIAITLPLIMIKQWDVVLSGLAYGAVMLRIGLQRAPRPTLSAADAA